MRVPTNPDEPLQIARELLALAEEQRVALEDGALDRFDALLEHRAALLERLGGGSSAQAGQLPAVFAHERDEAQALVATLGAVAEIDEQNARALADQRRGILDELPALNAGSRAAAAYRSASTSAAYVDTAS